MSDMEIVYSQRCEVRDSNESVNTGTMDEKTEENFDKMSLSTEPSEESNTSDDVSPEPSEESNTSNDVSPEPSEESNTSDDVSPEPSEESNTSDDASTESSEESNTSDDMSTEPSEESNSSDDVSTDDSSDWIVPSHEKQKILAKNYHLMGYPTPVLQSDVLDRERYHRKLNKKEFPHTAFLSFDLANFTSYAAHFCKYEARNKADIISFGSRNGAMDREIISTYRKHFGEEIKITLVDPNPDYEVDFKAVDDLIEARPQAVGNCILLIIWPESRKWNDGHDIDAVWKLEPHAALVLYDPTGVSGSEEFIKFLHNKTEETVESYEGDEYDVLENYAVEKVTGLEVYLDAGREVADGLGPTPPAISLYCLSLLKLKKQ